MSRGKHNEKYAAQPDNLAAVRAASMLRACAIVLETQADVLSQAPTRVARTILKRVLSGVLADVETVRISIKE